MTYIFRTECPICNKVDEVVSPKPNPRFHCGDCLMERTELVVLTCTQLAAQHD